MRDFLAAARNAVRSPSRATIADLGRNAVRVASVPYHARPLPAWVGPAWTIYLLIAAVNRGSDLLFAPDGISEASAWVNLFGNLGYGIMLMTLAGMLLAAAVIHKVLWLVIAHGIGIGIYVMYGIALLQGVVTAGQGFGWRHGVGMLLLAVLHAGRLFALRDEMRSWRA